MSGTADTDDTFFYRRLVSLADSLVAGFDLLELADQLVTSCVEFLPVRNAGIMLDDQRGNLLVFASTSEETRLLELLELQNDDGPCLDAFSSGAPVLAPDLANADGKWPGFVAAASLRGIVGAYALPMRLRDRTIGALNLFCETPAGLNGTELDIAHVMADMATLGILNHWTVRRHEVLAEQLQVALDSRIVIEQAKGVIAERGGVDMSAAFEMLRGAARRSRRPMTEVARGITSGTFPALDAVSGPDKDPLDAGPAGR